MTEHSEERLRTAARLACKGLPAVPQRVIDLLHPDEIEDFIANPGQAREFVETLVACGEPGINDPVEVGKTVAGTLLLRRE